MTLTNPVAARVARARERASTGSRALSVVVVLGAVMAVLDTTIVNVALNTFGREFSAPLSSVQWVATAYMLALATVIPLVPWAIDRFGAKRLWMAAVTLFVAGSVLSALAWSIGSLIVFRILQGVGGGIIMPAGQTILARAAGPAQMGRVLAFGVGVPALLGPVLGPVIGGAVLDWLSWRWIFLLNLPIGGLALALAPRLLPPAKPVPGPPIDLVGLALLSPGLAIFVYGLSQVGAEGSLAAPSALPFLIAGSALVAAFVRHARRAGRGAILDVELFRHRTFAAATSTGFLFGVVHFGVMLLLPLYFLVVRGESTLTTGLLVAPLGVGIALSMPIAGRLTDQLGAGRVVPVGLVCAVVGTLGYALMGARTSYFALAGWLVLRGIGLGATMTPTMAAAYEGVQRSDIARAATTQNIMQRVGGAVGTALMAVVLQSHLTHAAGVPARTALTGLHGTVAEHAAAAGPLTGAFARTFALAVAITALALIPAMFLPRRPRAGTRPSATPGVETLG